MAWITMDIIVICLILGMYKCTVGLKTQPRTIEIEKLAYKN